VSAQIAHVLRLRDNQTEPLWPGLSPPAEGPEARDAILQLLRRFSGCTPDAFGSRVAKLHDFVWKGRDGAAENSVFTLRETGDGAPALATWNTLGVLRLQAAAGRVRLTVEIGSRFDPADRQFFLNYLLQRVFGGSMTDPVDLGTASLWELLVALLFRQRLLAAHAQGIFKRYTRFDHNDARFRGTLDLPRHLQRNVPFTGAVACTTHEFSHDTPIARLARSALWHLANKYPRLLGESDPDAMEARRAFEQHTPSWRAGDLSRYLRENLRPIRHACFTAYEPLRLASLAVLRDEGAALYEDDAAEEAEGVLFDGAWLWEHYLAALLVPEPIGMTHRTVEQANGIRVFQRSGYRLFPDFHHASRHVVLDAKYKRDRNSPTREDLHQVLAYMFLTGSRRGGIIVPRDEGTASTGVSPLAIADGAAGSPSFWAEGSEAFWHQIVFQRPESSLTPGEFLQRMREAEITLRCDVAECWRGKMPPGLVGAA
jgi:5-methylcytosine-specific restriction endonuclease McrBC regulatory subunit McrC